MSAAKMPNTYAVPLSASHAVRSIARIIGDASQRSNRVAERPPADTLRAARRAVRRRAWVWLAWRIPALPLLAIAGGVGAVKAWDGIGAVGFALAPFFALYALYVHVGDMARVAGSPVRLLRGEALGRLAAEYEESTFAFDIGRKRDLLVDVDHTAVIAGDGTLEPEEQRGCRALRTSRRVRHSLESGQRTALLVLDDRAFDTLAGVDG
jgi:hypothetical protein